MKRILILACAFSLASCVSTGPSREQVSAAYAANNEANQQCRAQFKLRVPLTSCMNEAANRLVRPYYPFPDLFDVLLATRMSLAEKQDAGQITEADAQLEFAKVNSQLLSEGNRRIDQQRMNQLQSEALVRSSIPITCTTFGNMTNCY
jgi:hypothetical protein